LEGGRPRRGRKRQLNKPPLRLATDAREVPAVTTAHVGIAAAAAAEHRRLCAKRTAHRGAVDALRRAVSAGRLG